MDSCRRVCNEIVRTTSLSVLPSTAYNYTRKGRNELYGRPFEDGGSLGKCEYLWCKKQDDGKLAFLTREEEQVKENLIKKYFGNVSEKAIIVKGMVETGEITQDEAWSIFEELTDMRGGDNFMLFLSELQEKIGCQVIRGTYVERKELRSAF